MVKIGTAKMEKKVSKVKRPLTRSWVVVQVAMDPMEHEATSALTIHTTPRKTP
jgi:hypothetical protein